MGAPGETAQAREPSAAADQHAGSSREPLEQDRVRYPAPADRPLPSTPEPLSQRLPKIPV